MVKIDLKDRKILYELDLNCRQSNTQIGKKVGLRKDVVAYRIKKLQEEGVITKFWTAINTYKLGYNVFRAYISFQDVNKELKNEIIQYFVNCKNIWAILTFKGEIDLDVIFWVKNIYKFYQFWNKTLDKYRDYFAKVTVSVLIETISHEKSYLLPNKEDKSERTRFHMFAEGKTVKIDKLDYQLLDELALNARAPLTELAEKLDCSSQMINYRMKNLKKTGIIVAYRIDVDKSKLGLKDFSLSIYLKEPSKRNQILNYIKCKPFIIDIMGAIGWTDLQFEVVVKDVDELMLFMEELDSKYPNAIRKQIIWINEKNHKERWLPERDEEDFKPE